MLHSHRQKKWAPLACAIGVTALSVSPAVTTAAEWTPFGPAPILTGPYSGRTSAVVCSPSDRNLLYVGGASGGIWRTTNGGLNWSPLTDHLPALAIGAMAMDPSDERVIYAGTGEANFANHSLYGLGLYKTVDGGDNWTLLAQGVFAGRTFSRIIVSPADPNMLFAAIAPAGGFQPTRNAAKSHPLADGPVGVFRSVDAGLTWTPLLNGLPATPATDLAMDSVNPNVLYAAFGDIFGRVENGIYKSVDGGESWTKLGGGLPPSPGRISIAVAPVVRPQRVYALITDTCDQFGGGAPLDDIYRSDDGGETWTPTNAGGALQATYGWYLSTIIVDGHNPDRFYAGGVSLIRSTNGGMSYTNITPPHVDMHALAFDAINRLIVCDDGGVHRLSSNGSMWLALNNDLAVVQFYPGISVQPTDVDFILGGTQDNGTNRRLGGAQWTRRLDGDGGFTALHPATPNVMFAEFQGTGNLQRSTNNGNTFAPAGEGINTDDRNCFIPPVIYHPTDPAILFYATHRIYKSTNTGSSWSVISEDLTSGPPYAVRSLAIAPSNPNTLYAAANDGRVLVSVNGGATWEIIRENLPGGPRVTRELAIDPADDSTLYVAVSRFGAERVLMAREHGQLWSAIDGDLPDAPVNCVAAHRTGAATLIYAGTDRGIYRTCDGGQHWSRMSDLFPNAVVNDLVIDLGNRRVAAGTLGRGVWSFDALVDADVDRDRSVDLFDVAAFTGCFTGPADAPGHQMPTPECSGLFDLDFDGDVDAQDHRCVTRLFGGP